MKWQLPGIPLKNKGPLLTVLPVGWNEDLTAGAQAATLQHEYHASSLRGVKQLCKEAPDLNDHRTEKGERVRQMILLKPCYLRFSVTFG